MKDLEYVIWFLLTEKKFDVEFRRGPTGFKKSFFISPFVEIVLKYWDGQEIHQLLKIREESDPHQLHEFILLMGMHFESDLKAKGIFK